MADQATADSPTRDYSKRAITIGTGPRAGTTIQQTSSSAPVSGNADEESQLSDEGAKDSGNGWTAVKSSPVRSSQSTDHMNRY